MIMEMRFLTFFILIHCLERKYCQKIIKKNNIKGIYKIYNLFNNNNLGIDINDNVLFWNKNFFFNIYEIEPNSNKYLIRSNINNKFLGIDEQSNISIYKEQEALNKEKIIWEIINIKKNLFFIKNIYNNKYLEANNTRLHCLNEKIFFSDKVDNNGKVNKKFIFRLQKFYEEAKMDNTHKNYINKENIDILIKYIDLVDKKLNREGILQIYKDFDNEEIRYSLRSILKNIPWVRKIFILMPNEKVKYLKSYEEIKEKIVYIKDKDLLGFDSANIFAFTFNLYKLEKFGVSKNFIYIEDDFFIGKPLKKSDFFYYDENKRKVLPFLLTVYFQELNKSRVFNRYYNLYKIKDFIHPHSGLGWWLSIFNTDKYFIEKYNLQIINTNFTHNAISENLDDLKQIYEEIKDYEHFNETIYSKERHILTLNQPHFVNLYQLNVKHKKVNSKRYRYIGIEKIKKFDFKVPLFVLNTGGNHIPLKRNYKIQRKIMNKVFSYKTRYEIVYDKNKSFNYIKKISIEIINIFIIFSFIKIILNF